MCTVGKRLEAVCSSFWCYVDETSSYPSCVCFIPSRETESFVSVLERCFNVIADKQLDFKGPVVIDETDIVSAKHRIVEAISKFKSEGFEVTVDITSGRKTMSVAAYQAAMEGEADEIVYFHLKDPSFESRLYPTIPRVARQLVFLRGLRT